MTYKQAINYLFSSGFSDEQVKEVVRALNHEPCEDCISREELLEQISIWGGDTDTLIEYIEGMPSVTPVTQWHRIKTRHLTEEEKDEMCLNDNYYTFMYDCEMPDEEQEVLIKTKWGIEKTTYHTDDGCYFEDYEDEDDVIAWTELPEWEE